MDPQALGAGGGSPVNIEILKLWSLYFQGWQNVRGGLHLRQKERKRWTLEIVEWA